MKKIELLAPAGSYDSLMAAYNAGADAVYAGGTRFGARAYADNFTERAFVDAIHYAHMHGKKLYLTLNTLLKEQEIELQLYEYLAPLYEAGLDGVIIQDIGVFSYVRKVFPDLPVHASTQMTVTGVDAARFLRDQGAVRIVPARELSLKELAAIKKASGLELEVFIHGALCYCYSGLCFFSSLLGGRSGNRGRCAQPCRLPYELNGRRRHYLSPKDLCGLSVIPDLYEIGADSLKIEGRMKNPAYTAGVVSVYRKYLDLYEKFPDDYKVQEQDLELLMDLYNRGGMTEGYFRQHNSGNMISAARPNHFGLPAGTGKVKEGRILCTFSKDIFKGDMLELRDSEESVVLSFHASESRKAGTQAAVPLRSFAKPPSGQTLMLYRTNNTKLSDRFFSLAGQSLKRQLRGTIYLKPGLPARLELTDGSLSVTCYGETVQPAQKQPLDEDTVRRQMQKTGATSFVLVDLDCKITGSVFMPKQALNALRRQALEMAEAQILASFARQPVKALTCQDDWVKNKDISPDGMELSQDGPAYRLSASVETEEQYHGIKACPGLARIDIDSSLLFLEETERFRESCAMFATVKGGGKTLFLRMPAVFRAGTRAVFEKRFEDLLYYFDGFVVRNIDEHAFVLNRLKSAGTVRQILCDFTIYGFSKRACAFWKSKAKEAGLPCFLTAPIELNAKEIAKNRGYYGELVVYGRYPMMVSAGCVERTAAWLDTEQL